MLSGAEGFRAKAPASAVPEGGTAAAQGWADLAVVVQASLPPFRLEQPLGHVQHHNSEQAFRVVREDKMRALMTAAAGR